MPRDKLPDILRPTELCDFGDLFRTSPRPARTLAAALGLAALLAGAQLTTGRSMEAERGPVATTADAGRR